MTGRWTGTAGRADIRVDAATGSGGVRLADRHPLMLFFALAYAISWPLWGLAGLAAGWPSVVLLVAGGFGPAAAAAVVLRRRRSSWREWLRPLLRWRVSPRAYGYVLGLPVLIMITMNAVLALLGIQPAWDELPGRIPGYLQTLLVTAVIFGGQEEPGWRGFALGALQQRHSPVVATMILGLGWGVWHIPLYGPAGFVVPLVLAFFYTVVYNRTGSVLLCVVLHGGLTAAQDHLLLAADSPVVDVVLLCTYLLAAVVIVALTRGRLGLADTRPDRSERRR